MIFHATAIAGVYEVALAPRADERGFFARLFCADTMAAQGLQSEFPQINTSWCQWAGTFRGFHYQTGAAAEAKLVRCIRGAIFDAVVDLRAHSPTYGRALGIALTADNRRMLYLPQGVAHGYLSLQDDSEIIYLTSTRYTPAAEQGIRFDDPLVRLEWPLAPRWVSEKDRSWPTVTPHTLQPEDA